MKKILTILLITILTSCGNAFDKEACLNSVKAKFPHADIYTLYQGSDYFFVVIDSSNVYKVSTGNYNNSNVTDVKILERK